jgi:solute carrier family 6 GABA transporter-like protein 1
MAIPDFLHTCHDGWHHRHGKHASVSLRSLQQSWPTMVCNTRNLRGDADLTGHRFIPYLMAVVIIAIPGLILEVAIGNAYRGGPVVAYNAMNKRLRGTGLSLIFIGFMVLTYFNVIVTWFMVFFARSFQSPLPWADRDPEEYFLRDILRTVDPVEGSGFASYPEVGLVGELAGWCAFVWFLVWLW